MSTVPLKCQCGAVQGTATNITPTSGNRVVCCCSDCQAFASYLGGESRILDEFGGTDIFQTTQSQLRISKGQDKLQGMRLSEKGMLRWYTSCCKTPVGNTINASMPFVGVIHSFMDLPDRDTVLGPVRAYVQTQYAIGAPSYPTHHKKYPLGITLRIISKILLWKLRGNQKPSVFFDESGRPNIAPIIRESS